MQWLNEESRKFLGVDYLEAGQSAENRLLQIATTAESYTKIDGFAKKFYDYLSKGWFSMASPVWANYGKTRGLPISCFGSYLKDDIPSILTSASEVGMMSKLGGGTSGYFGDLRERGSKVSVGGDSSGPVHFMQLFDTVTNIISQGNIRRGAFAAYLPVEHPDAREFLQIRDKGNPIQNMNYGICIGNQWMRDMIAGDKKKRDLWAKIIQKRYESGFPYVFFSDNANDQKPQWYKDAGQVIHASNLCSEIMLPSSADESFVCCLSAMNLEHYDDWKGTDAVEMLTIFLDTVIEEFIAKSKGVPFMEKSRQFAENHRAVGLGVLGWHSYLQNNMQAFGSLWAKAKNIEIFKHLREKSYNASIDQGTKLGEAPVASGHGMRNATTMAVMPTRSSAFIMNTSKSIEPDVDNYHVNDSAKGLFSHKNYALKELLRDKNKNTKGVWSSILTSGGSVSHLDFLSDEEKEVFKTFGEISQRDVVQQAIDRQPFIDQGQSLNLKIHSDIPPKQVSDLMIYGWENGLKSFYYQRSTNKATELIRDINSCSSCEG